MIIAGAFKCTGAHACPTRDCKTVTQDLRAVSLTDDAFDLAELERQGTIHYMCETDAGEALYPKFRDLCIEAKELKCGAKWG